MPVPNFLNQNDLIGITALSSGCSDSIDEIDLAINNLSKEGFRVIKTNNVYGNYIVSGSKEERINELRELLKEDIKLLQIARGGNFLYELLDSVPYEKIVSKRLLVQGYSDVTSLLYILTTKYDLLTIYGLNGKSYGYKQLESYHYNNLNILKGNIVNQTSYDNESISINGDFASNGIIIGGCLEVLKDLIGTKYDETTKFIEKYKDHKIIWYFDIYNMDPVSVYLTLLQLKEASWFKYSDTFIIGKVLLKQSEDVMTYKDAYEKALFGNIVYDANIGHVKPMFTIINGSLANIVCYDNKITLKQVIKNE